MINHQLLNQACLTLIGISRDSSVQIPFPISPLTLRVYSPGGIAVYEMALEGDGADHEDS